MTTEQENILELFKNNNQDLAGLVAVATRNTQWFKEEILDKICLIEDVINRYCRTYRSDKRNWSWCTEPICSQVFFKGIQMKALYDNDDDLIHYNIWTDDIIIDDITCSISFQCDENHEYALKEELEELGIKVTVH